MACPCCGTKTYCLNLPCSKYGQIEFKWAGMTIVAPVGSQGVGQQIIQDRSDTSCTWTAPNSNGPVFFGVRFTMTVGIPFTRFGQALASDKPVCVPSTTSAEGYAITGVVGYQMFAIMGRGASETYGMYYMNIRYSLGEGGGGNTKFSLLGGGAIQKRDVREAGFGLFPHFFTFGTACDGIIDDGLALFDQDPAIKLIQTSTGTQCGGTETDSRGFPAKSGPYNTAAECAAECENFLP